ncbi:transcriptional regulator [Afipia sp. P52-10]|jgi:CRP-like cAMP-binding protein|uniref:Crp/Fnr family transcriptional regulator n=1 Tax=Afipia sp. P52-10 TaxID=1429916 RepID=UPI0003DF2043|nr:Crp/Fnr family transcriptional regulator [Afipia sp. P52-10]ETR76311.1 transcriptional regulator [Afipia sp. P52-10]
MDRKTITASLVKRMRFSEELDDDDVLAIETLPIAVKDFADNQHVVSDGEQPTQCCLLIEGFAVRAKTTKDGGRQILSIHIPGDIPDLQSLYLQEMDHDLIALTACTVGFIPHLALRELVRKRPNIAEVFWRDTLIDAAMFRQWIVNVGQRQAPSRMAHLILELQRRLEIVGRTKGDSFRLPMTQDELADALGLTAVHVNRTAKQLRQDGLLLIQRQTVKILNKEKLKELADFDDAYLHQSTS